MSNYIEKKGRDKQCCCCGEKEKVYIPVPRSWGSLTGNIYDQKDLIFLLQSLLSSPAEKEVISVLTYSSEAPSEAAEGARYADSVTNTICTYIEGAWVSQTPNEEAIYITDDTIHMYVYNTEREQLIDVTGQKIDNLIYVNDLKEDLKPYIDDGIYGVCYTYKDNNSSHTLLYSMTVSHVSSDSDIRYTQTLQNKDGYAVRAGVISTGEAAVRWGAWQWYRYSFEGRNAKKPHLEVSFLNGKDGDIYVRDKNNAIEDDDYLVLYYWNRSKKRITAFAGGTEEVEIWPVRWGDIWKTSMRKRVGWRDDWRRLPYTISDIMHRITNISPEDLDYLMTTGGILKHSLLGSMSFVGGPSGNGYSTRLWIGVARGLSYMQDGYTSSRTNKVYVYAKHFRIDDLMHRIPFYIRCLSQGVTIGNLMYYGSVSRKPHLYFEELDVFNPEAKHD